MDIARRTAMRFGLGADNQTTETAEEPALALVGPDAARLARLVDEYFDFAWRSLRRLGVTEGAVDDAAQRLFLVVARRLHTIDPERERSFIFGSAVRIAAAERRTQRRQPELSVYDDRSDASDPLPSPEELLDLKRARTLLDLILDRMPMDLRAAFILAEGEGLTRREIGELCGIPEGTAGSRVRRAREFFDLYLTQLRPRNGADP